MRKLIMLLGICALTALGYAQKSNLWVKTYGTWLDDRALSLDITDDGGLFVVGYNEELANIAWQVLAMKVDSSGNIIWAKGYDELLESKARGCQLKNGNFLLWGHTTAQSDTSDDAFLLLLSPAGDILFQKAYGVEGSDCYRFNKVEKTKDGGYIACGDIMRIENEICENSKGWIVRLNSSGKIIFQKVIANTEKASAKYFWLRDIHLRQDGSYICLGSYSSSKRDGDSRVWIAKMNAKGKIRWQRSYEAFYRQGEVEYIYPRKIIPTKDKGYMLVGREIGWRPYGSWCAKLNAKGKVKWTLRLELDTWDDVDAQDIIETKDGGYLIAGGLYKNNKANHGWLAKLIKSGKVTFQKTYILKNENTGFYGAEQLSSGGYALAGWSHTDVAYSNFGQRIESDAVLLMTTKTNGLTCPGVPPKAHEALVKTIRLDQATPTVAISQGAALARISNFVAENLSLTKKSWGNSATEKVN